MDEVVLPDGTVQRNGRPAELAESGLYPPRLGMALVDAWLAGKAAAAAGPEELAQSCPVVQPPLQQKGRRKRPAADLEEDPWGAAAASSSSAQPVAPRRVLNRKADLCSESAVDSDDPWGSASIIDEPDPWA
jgi:hypothetical protein